MSICSKKLDNDAGSLLLKSGLITIVTLLLFFVIRSASAVNENNMTVYLIGDSTMADKSLEAYPETGWGTPFAHFFDSTVTVENHAKNGRSTRTFLEEGCWDPIVAGLEEGDYVFIQFGHNDEVETKEQYTTPDNFKANLVKYVLETRGKGAKPVLLTSIVRRKFERGKLIDTHAVYSELMREVARSETVPLIDMDSKSFRLLKQLDPKKSKDLFNHLNPGAHPNYPEGVTDNTHFNRYGAYRMAELVLEGIRELDLELSDHINKTSFEEVIEKLSH